MTRIEWFLLIVVIVCAGVLGALYLKKTATPPTLDAKCGYRDEDFTVGDTWMSGIIESGTHTKVFLGWYDCRPLERGDVVLFQPYPGLKPVARIARGVPGDQFKLVRSLDGNSWNIEINGTMLMAGPVPYRFGSAAPAILSLYEAAHKGLLDQSSVLLFSSLSPGDADSGSLGVVHRKDILGKIDLR